jgi:transcriptional regulator with XRE-family HTH domain
MKPRTLTTTEIEYRLLRELRSRFAWAKYEIDGFTGRKVARHMGITEAYLSMILRGKRTPEKTIQRAIEAVNDFPNLKHP